MTKIILNEVTANNMYAEWLEWVAIGKERWAYEENWKRSPIARENRRESIVYDNCAGYLDCLSCRTNCSKFRNTDILFSGTVYLRANNSVDHFDWITCLTKMCKESGSKVDKYHTGALLHSKWTW